MAPVYAASTSAWRYWTSINNTTNTSAYHTSAATWQAWSQGTASSSVGVWQGWVDLTWRTQPQALSRQPQAQVRPPTAEQLRIAETRRLEAEAQTKINQMRRKQAHDKSVELLESLLDREQLASFRATGHFDVIVGQRSYRLGDGQPKLLGSPNGERFSFCIHPRENFPKGDELAAMKLMIESNERLFLNTANATRLANAA